MDRSDHKLDARTGSRPVQGGANAGSPSTTTFTPVDNLVINNPAPNSSVPAVPTGHAVKS